MKKLFNFLYILIISFSIVFSIAFSCNITFSFNKNKSLNGVIAESNYVQTIANIPVKAVTYQDNKGYEYGILANNNLALGQNYLNIRINTNSDAVAIKDIGDNKYLIDMSKGDINALMDSVVIEANYNFNSTQNIANDWNLSFDSAQNILGFDNLGEVGEGAFIVETSYDGKNYNQTNSALTTVNVTKAFNPSLYNVSNNKYKQAYVPSGKDINKGVYIRIRFAYEVYRTTYKYYDKDQKIWIQNSFTNPEETGINYKFLSKTITYYNILETANLYIANNTGAVGFHNLTNDIEIIKDDLLDKMVSQVYFSKVNQENYEKNEFEIKYAKYISGELNEDGTNITFTRQEKMDYYNSNSSEDKLDNKKLTLLANQYYQGETLNSGDMTFSGFSLDNLGNDNYIINYKFNGIDMGQMRHGALFTKNGRYDIYVSTPWEKDKTHYTIYVNDRSNESTLGDYFDNNFITNESKRIYDMESNLPVFVKGSIFYQIKNSENNVPLSGKITKYIDDQTTKDVYTFLYENVLVESDEQPKNIILNKNANNTGSLVLEPGYYYATFYTTTNYLDGITGDYYTISYMFKVVDEDSVIGPVVNQTILNSFANISRFNSLYYGVEQKNVNDKIITFAFSSQESAYNFAYKIESDKVTYKNGEYHYNDKTYTSSILLGKDLNDNALKLVKQKYFDASDYFTYLTIREQSYDQVAQDGESAEFGESILDLKYVNQNIIVFTADSTQENNLTPIPFLNDGNIAILNTDGTISQQKTDMQFISVSNYESNLIKAINIETKQEYILAYDENIENQLISYNAPSGSYQIVETNLYGDGTSDTSIYYANYIAQENTASALITYLYNDEVVTTTIDKSKNNIVINANSLVIESITNTLDPYSIIKISHGSETTVMSIAELKNYKIDKLGNYNIEIVDRLANKLSLTVNINNAVDAVILKYDDETTQTTFVGHQTILKDGKLKDNYDFMGWTYETLDKEYTKTITPTQNQDIILTAVYYHSTVNITFKDGDFVYNLQAKPEDTIDFDTNLFSKQGFELVGFMWNNGNRNILYTYRISSVPNVENMEIHALYKKVQNSVTIKGITLVDGDFVYTNAQFGTAFPQTVTPNDMKFVGWMKLGVEGGVIYKDIIPNLSGDVILSAVYEKLESKENISEETIEGAGTISGTVNNNNNFTNNLFNKSINYSIISLILFAIYFVFAKIKNYLINKKKIQKNNKQIYENVINNNEEIKINKKIKINLKNNKKSIFKLIFKRKNIKYLTATLCLVLAFILGTQGIFADVAKFRVQDAIVSSYEQSLTLQQEKIYNNLQDNVEEIKQNYNDQQNKDSVSQEDNKIQQIKNLSKTLLQEQNQTTEYTLTDDEAFLYSEVIVDLTTLGYSVFPASVKFNNKTVYGIAYTTGETVFEKDNEENVVYIGTGFTAFLNQISITEYAIGQGLTITPLEELNDYEDIEEDCEIKYILSFEESYKDQETNTILYNHYIQNNQYVHYAIYDYQFHATFTKIEDLSSAETIFDKTAGKVYSYDEGYVVYDPYWQKEETILNSIFASSINNTATKEQTKLLYNSFVESQDCNYLTVEKGTYIYYSPVNLNEIYLQLQQESILGVSAEQWRDVENQLSEGVYYYIVEKQETDKDGNLLWITENGEKTTTQTETPSMITDIEYSLYPQPPVQPNWGLIIFGAILIIGGVVLTVLTMGAGSPAGVAATSAGTTILGTITSIMIKATVFVLVKLFPAFAIDIGLQSIIIGAQGGSVKDINWKRAIITSAFNGLSIGFENLVKSITLAGRILKGVALTVLEGFINYIVEVACGSSQEVAWQEFGWGILFGFIFNSIDLISYIRATKKLNQAQDMLDDVYRLTSKNNVDNSATDILQNSDSGIKKLDEASQTYLSKTLPSPEKATYFGIDGKKLSKKEFIEYGANGTIEWKSKTTLLFDKNGNPITKLSMKNGVIDLSPLSHGTLDYSYLKDLDFGDRVTNLNRAYNDLLDRWKNIEEIPDDVFDYLDKIGKNYNDLNFDLVKKICSGGVYSLHETVEKTILLIPSNMHTAISHIGGIALYKSKNNMPEYLKNLIKGAQNT